MRTLILAAITLLATTTFAQDAIEPTALLDTAMTNEYERLELEAEFGLGNVSLRGTTDDQNLYNLNQGLTGGILLGYRFSKNWKFYSGGVIGKMAEGTRFNDNSYDGRTNKDYSVDNNLIYFRLPIVAQYSVGNKVNWVIEGGFSNAFFLQYEGETLNNDQSMGEFPSDFNKVNTELVLGGGVSVPIKNKVIISLLYKNFRGVTDILKDNRNMKTNYGQLSLNFSFI